MEQSDTILARMDKVRQSILDICQVLEDNSQQLDLRLWGGAEEKTLTTYRKKLAANAYNVAVVGEASYGKSTWINALLGHEVLPTAVPISTSKVFRVSKASYKAYRLRFEDNSTKDITPDELHTYGSFSDMEQANAHVDLSKLRWIEVEYPAEFLPAGISLLDTPGLGTVNLAHEALTKQIIRDYADAVIFVLDSTKEPLSEPGVKFLQDILEVTPHIFFLQTKIDAKRRTHDSEHGHPWQEMMQRNQNILHIVLKKTEKVWPISSDYLRDATRNSSKRNAYLKKSHFQELKPALELFLFKAAGWQYCTKLLKVVSQSYETSWKHLVIRLKTLEALTSQELTQMQQMQQKKLKEIQKFEDEWGEHGEKRRGLLSDARKIVNSAKNEITEWIRLNGKIETAQRAKITGLKTFKDAEKFVKNPENQVAGKIIDHWYSLTNDAQDSCSKLLGKLEQEADSLLTLPEIHPSVSVQNPITLHYDWGASAKGAIDSLTHSFTYWYLASAMLHITFPLSIVGSIGSMTATALANANEQLQKAQQDLYTQLQSTMEEIRKGFLDPNQLLYNGQNLVNYYFDTFFSSLERLTEKIVSERVQSLQQESARLEKDIELDEHKRSAKIRVYQQQLDAWEVHGQLIKGIDIELLSLTAVLETADQW